MQTGKGGRVDRCPHLQHDIYVMHIVHNVQDAIRYIQCEGDGYLHIPVTMITCNLV